MSLGKLSEGSGILDRSIQAYEEMLSANLGDETLRRILANMLIDRSDLDYQLGRFVDSERAAHRAAALFADMASSGVGSPEALDPMFWGIAEIRLAMTLREQGRTDEALTVHDSSVERLNRFAQASQARDTIFYLHRTKAERGWTLARVPARYAAGVADLDAAIGGWERLAKQFPQIPSYLRSQGLGLLYRGRLKVLLGQREAAEKDFKAAHEIFEGLVRKNSDIVIYRNYLGETLHGIGPARRRSQGRGIALQQGARTPRRGGAAEPGKRPVPESP